MKIAKPDAFLRLLCCDGFLKNFSPTAVESLWLSAFLSSLHSKYSPLLLLGVFSFFTANAFCFNADSIRPSVLRIVNISEDEDGEESVITGSGFVIQSEGNKSLLATNQHVIEDSKPGTPLLILRASGNQIEKYEGTVIWEDELRDLAVVEVSGLRAKPLTLQRSNPSQGEDIYALGFPSVVDDDESVEFFVASLKKSTEKIISDPTGKALRFVEPTVNKAALRRVVQGKWDNSDKIPDFRIIEHDVNISFGNSGGPLLSECGRVIGINTSVGKDTGNFSVVRKASHIQTLIDALSSKGIKLSTTSAPCENGFFRSMRPFDLILIFLLFFFVVLAGLAAFRLSGKSRPAVETDTKLPKHPIPPVPFPQEKKSQANPPPLRQKKDTPPPVPSSRATTLFRLDGINPESGHTQVTLQFTAPSANQRILLGRQESLVHLFIPNTSISGQHASFSFHDGQLYVEDRNSSNGTKINGKPLRAFDPCCITLGDTLEFGEVKLLLKLA